MTNQQKYRFSDGIRVAVEFDSVPSPQEWMQAATHALRDFRAKSTKKWHQGDIKKWIGHSPCAHIHWQYAGRKIWYSAQGCTEATWFCIPARQKELASKTEEVDWIFEDGLWLVKNADFICQKTYSSIVHCQNFDFFIKGAVEAIKDQK